MPYALGAQHPGGGMNWSGISEFIAMGGYGLYVWGSLGMCGAVIVAELALLHLRRVTLAREVQSDNEHVAHQVPETTQATESAR